jgi:hypothetical protein
MKTLGAGAETAVKPREIAANNTRLAQRTREFFFNPGKFTPATTRAQETQGAGWRTIAAQSSDERPGWCRQFRMASSANVPQTAGEIRQCKL